MRRWALGASGASGATGYTPRDRFGPLVFSWFLLWERRWSQKGELRRTLNLWRYRRRVQRVVSTGARGLSSSPRLITEKGNTTMFRSAAGKVLW
jgi:hypothetical protein